MEFKLTETGSEFRPVNYVCELSGIRLVLNPPYKSDPWGVYLTTAEGSTIHKDNFRLRSKERDENNWESIEDLEEAKEKAFELMEDFIGGHLRHWSKMSTTLRCMKALPISSDMMDEMKTLVIPFLGANEHYGNASKMLKELVIRAVKADYARDQEYLEEIKKILIPVYPCEAYDRVDRAWFSLKDLPSEDHTSGHTLTEKARKQLEECVRLCLELRKAREETEEKLTDFLDKYMKDNGVWGDKQKLMALISITPPIYLRFQMWEQKFALEEEEAEANEDKS